MSLALECVSHREIMDHVGWKTSKTALSYIKLRQVLSKGGRGGGAAAKLADLSLGLGESYRRINNQKGFTKALPV